MLHTILTTGKTAGELLAKLPVNEVIPFLMNQLLGLWVLGKTNASPTALEAVVRLAMKTL